MKNAMDLWRGRLMPPWWDDDSVESMMGFSPACEIDEEPDHFRICVDVPGMSKDDIKVEVMDNHLVISGERKSEKKEGRRSERSYGRFERSFTLPVNIDAEKIEANYENGVLELAVPKTESSKPRSVEIHAGSEGILGRFLNRGKTVEGTEKSSARKDRAAS